MPNPRIKAVGNDSRKRKTLCNLITRRYSARTGADIAIISNRTARWEMVFANVFYKCEISHSLRPPVSPSDTFYPSIDACRIFSGSVIFISSSAIFPIYNGNEEKIDRRSASELLSLSVNDKSSVFCSTYAST